jgi:hypothetical protein
MLIAAFVTGSTESKGDQAMFLMFFNNTVL